MDVKSFLSAVTFCLLGIGAFAQSPAIIPQPVQVQYTGGAPFKLTAATTIGGNTAEAQQVAQQLAGYLQPATGFHFVIRRMGMIQLNLLSRRDTVLGDEGYRLTVKSGIVQIAANRPAGLFYGVQTLLQLLPSEIESPTVQRVRWSIPACSITDYPRFAWRGMMLDVSRNFFSASDVKRFIDDMARHKYNVFHWHLTDDEGWRIEIKSYPRLTEVGGCRVQRYGKWGDREAPQADEPATDCGFYTQEIIREIVAYAAAKNVQVLPEIDVPGHSSAAVAAYPELCCTKDPNVKVSPGHNFAEWHDNGTFTMLTDNTLNPSDEAVYRFLDKVFGEVAALFPFSYIHAGGDECYHGYWEKDPNCQALMAREGLKNSLELQSYFTKRVEKIVKSKGKKLIGWDEILEGGLAPEASVMSWRGSKGGIEAAKQGHYVVMTPNDFVYIDLLQGEPAVEPDQTSYKKVRLKKAYSFDPLPEGVDPTYILGGEANLWTEKVTTIRQVEYMSFPRAWAISDIYWSPKGTNDWEKFVPRMEAHMKRSDVGARNYARSAYDAIVTSSNTNDTLTAAITTEISGLDVYYTLNETLPDAYSVLYTGPVQIPKGDVTLKVMTYRNGQPVGKMIALSREQLLKRAK
jgi:hexosaminidase